MTVTDPYGLTATSSFTVSITNTAPAWTTIPNYSILYKTSLSIPLAGYISDLEGGPFTISGTYLISGGSSVAISSGLMSWSGVDTLVIASSSKMDVGSYTITLQANDAQPLTSASASFTLTISSSNTAPKLVLTAPPNINLIH